MKLRISILLILISWFASAAPARKEVLMLSQPDGSRFSAIFGGDEFLRIKTTSEGNAIIQGSDGWWYYAIYESDGSKRNTGYRIGEDAPRHILDLSRRIPYRTISGIAEAKRSRRPYDSRPNILQRTRAHTGILTRSDTPVRKNILVIMAAFKDEPFRYSRQEFANMLTQKGYNINGATGCVKDYFDSQFEGMFEFNIKLSEIITLDRNKSYYGENDSNDDDKNPQEMIREACQKASETGIRFSEFDDDADGFVDNVFVIFSGGDEAEGAGDDCIWSHSWSLYPWIDLELDGKKIGDYACTSEKTKVYPYGDDDYQIAGIGTFCHEYSHILGLPDMYDTDYEETNGIAAALWGSTSLMDSGNQNNNGNTPPNLNAIEREILGLSEPVLIETDGSYTLDPIDRNGKYYRMETGNAGEYYLLECRTETGWDKYIGGSGMLVYHIDKSLHHSSRWTFDNTININPDHQCADLIEADCREDKFSTSQSLTNKQRYIKGVFFPNGNTHSITPEGNPAMEYWETPLKRISITGITKEGENISFSIIGHSEDTTPPAPIDIVSEKFQDAVILNFRSSRDFDGDAVISWRQSDDSKAEQMTVHPYKDGCYAATIEGLTPRTSYRIDIAFVIGGAKGKEESISILTSSRVSSTPPYIYLNNIERNKDNTFRKGTRLPLRIYNASGAKKIRWTFNGVEIKVGGDGYYTLNESGILKAIITWEDSEEIIMKTFNISQEQ